MKYLISSFGIWIAILITTCDGCAHMDGGPPPSIAIVPGICLEDLTGERVDQIEFNLLIEETLAQWERSFPKDFDAETASRSMENNPLTFFVVSGDLQCVHRGPGTWPGEPAKCLGFWEGVESTNIFIKHVRKGLHCTAIAHEISHVFSYWFLQDADHRHMNPKIWGEQGVVKLVQASFGGCK
jgi:hypothetical protein